MIKRLVCLATRCSGVNALARLQRRHRLLTLCYHNVLPDSAIGTSFAYRNTVGTAALRRHLEILANYYTFVSGDEVLAAVDGAALPERAALVTFDDGYVGWRHHAMPLLRRMGVPAVFHPCTGAIGATAPLWYEELTWIVAGWRRPEIRLPDGSAVAFADQQLLLRRLNALCKRLPDDDRRRYLDGLRGGDWRRPAAAEADAFAKLDWDDVRALIGGGFAIGSHTVDHPILSRLDTEALDRQLRDSKHAIEHAIGGTCSLLAYPNGGRDDVSALVVERAAAAGYRVAFTTTEAFSLPAQAPLRVGRWCVPPRVTDNVFRTLCSGVQLFAASGA
ncbi:MAG: polysaccharide deacetylase family protein [Planctomycetota bacterium]